MKSHEPNVPKTPSLRSQVSETSPKCPRLRNPHGSRTKWHRSVLEDMVTLGRLQLNQPAGVGLGYLVGVLFSSILQLGVIFFLLYNKKMW